MKRFLAGILASLLLFSSVSALASPNTDSFLDSMGEVLNGLSNGLNDLSDYLASDAVHDAVGNAFEGVENWYNGLDKDAIRQAAKDFIKEFGVDVDHMSMEQLLNSLQEMVNQYIGTMEELKNDPNNKELVAQCQKAYEYIRIILDQLANVDTSKLTDSAAALYTETMTQIEQALKDAGLY